LIPNTQKRQKCQLVDYGSQLLIWHKPYTLDPQWENIYRISIFLNLLDDSQPQF